MPHQRRSRLLALPGWLAPALAAGLLAAAPAAAPPADVALVPADAAVVLGLRLADLWAGDFSKPVREKWAKDMAAASAEIERLVGFRPEQIERLTVMLLGLGDETAVAIVRLNQPYDRLALIRRTAGDKAEEETYKGRELYVGRRGDAVCLLDERTYIVAHVDLLRRLLDCHGKAEDGPLTSARRALAERHDVVLGLNVPALLEQIGTDLPGELEPFQPLLLARSMALTADLGPETRADVVLAFPDAPAARKAGRSWHEGLYIDQGILATIRALKEQPGARKFLQLAGAVVKGTNAKVAGSMKAKVAGSALTAGTTARVDPLPLAVALSETLRWPSFSRARALSQENLKQIALAMHNYASAFGYFPADAVYDKSGKPLLSWRVQILPFLDEGALFKQFHLNEPWDSPHNKKLLDKMPSVYQDPRREKPPPWTYYQGFHGNGAFFEGKKGIRFADLTDGTSNTVMISEAAEPVPWTKPEDLPYDSDKPLPKLGGLFEGGFHVAMCDGSARFVPATVKPRTLHLVIQRNDGQPIPNDF
jgi:hypothetical protein